ncbi:RsiV family protein [Fusobacterium sp.]|uniref:RsiV family protein n=1 Tax=Fusobacterium sp. TaxID=68766 RepID=UPI002900AE95|nr:RsiV family protein [Fusobacterium sp.]MDU1912624.1 RsiV family protein [Fusobacterium sp.]
MKKIFFSMLVILFTACGGSKDIKVDKLSFQKKSDTFSYNITIPQIKGSGNKSVEELNKKLASDAEVLVNSIEEGKKGVSEFYEEGFETFENSFGMTSILIGTYGISKGDANGQGSSESINIRNKDGKLITFDDVFTKEGETYLNEQVKAVVQGNVEKVILNSNGDKVTMFFNDPEVNIRNASMFFESDDVCFLFQNYELTPHSEGQPVFRFPKTEIQKFLLK